MDNIEIIKKHGKKLFASIDKHMLDWKLGAEEAHALKVALLEVHQDWQREHEPTGVEVTQRTLDALKGK
jgi:hypothetical protein